MESTASLPASAAAAKLTISKYCVQLQSLVDSDSLPSNQATADLRLKAGHITLCNRVPASIPEACSRSALLMPPVPSSRYPMFRPPFTPTSCLPQRCVEDAFDTLLLVLLITLAGMCKHHDCLSTDRVETDIDMSTARVERR